MAISFQPDDTYIAIAGEPTSAQTLLVECLAMCGGNYNSAFFELLNYPIVQFWRFRDIQIKTSKLMQKATEGGG